MSGCRLAPCASRIPTLTLNRRWPVGELTPCVFSHHKEVNWRLVQPLPLPVDMRIQPGQCFADDHATVAETDMSPMADEQVGLFPHPAQRLVVLQLPIQEDIIPATHEISGCFHLSQVRAEVDRLPVVILGSVQKLFLERLGIWISRVIA